MNIDECVYFMVKIDYQCIFSSMAPRFGTACMLRGEPLSEPPLV